MIVIYQHGIIMPEQLPLRYRSGANNPELNFDNLWIGDKIELNNIMGNIESELIKQSLKRAGGVKSKAAELLGIKRTTLLEKMRKYHIKAE
jgi:DNA-binding NtrC family response regulator